MTSPNPPFDFHEPGKPIYTRARNLPGTRILGAAIKNSVICEGCVLTGVTVSESIIGIRTIVNRGARIERAVIMGADHYAGEKESDSAVAMGIGKGTVVSRAIIDLNAHIGKNVVIRGADGMPDSDGPGYAVRDGLVIVLKDATIPDGTHIG
jgi:glucose-1-phosphate adenylyltransferase